MRISAFALVMLAACSAGEVSDEQRREAALSAASAQARAKMGYFWERQAAPADNEYDFVLKASLPRGDGQAGEELVWVEGVARDAERVHGLLTVTPRRQPGLSRGDAVSFPETAILDWAFFRGEELIGHYTTRVLLDVMPPDEADMMRSLFGENPE